MFNNHSAAGAIRERNRSKVSDLAVGESRTQGADDEMSV